MNKNDIYNNNLNKDKKLEYGLDSLDFLDDIEEYIIDEEQEGNSNIFNNNNNN